MCTRESAFGARSSLTRSRFAFMRPSCSGPGIYDSFKHNATVRAVTEAHTMWVLVVFDVLALVYECVLLTRRVSCRLSSSLAAVQKSLMAFNTTSVLLQQLVGVVSDSDQPHDIEFSDVVALLRNWQRF